MIKTNNLREYSQKAILNKMPTDFIGIAKEYSSAKKQRMMSQQLFDSCHHEVSSIQKINKNLAKSLNRKKKQLKYVQAVRSRYISEVMQKEKLEELKQLELSRLRNKTIEERIFTDQKLADARERLMFRKKTQCQLAKKQLNHYKSQRMLDESRLYSKNQSRVQQIQEQKARIKDYYNRFFQNKNRKFMQNYKKMISSQKSKEQKFKTDTKNLERKLLLLKQDAKKKEEMLAELNNSIDSIRESRQSLRSSYRGSTTRTMTPLEVLTGVENPQRVKIKLITKN